MSTTTDNRVVEMRFDNHQFEKNANQSISTLGKLKEALKFDRSSVKSLDDLQRNTKDFNMDHLTTSIDRASDHFSALGVAGMTVINRLTNAAIDFGKRAVGAMTGGVNGGFAKYSAMTDAVQVMVINSGKSIDYVSGLMQDLQGYVDDTSYSFQQMTNAMGNFSAAGMELGMAEEMVEGIANWAATAGVNAVKAEAAFREVSSSVAQGFLSLRDAQTLMSLNMFTPDFRRLALVTAEAMGTIKKESDKYWVDIGTGAKEKWVEVTESNFAYTLKGKWFNNDVWEEMMHLYADLGENLDELDLQLLEAAGLSEDFGQSAFDAAYEAKTFADALGAVRDTISTGWSNTFEAIFGNYEEASELWTELASYFQEIVGSIAEGRNLLLSGWKELGGRLRLMQALFEFLEDASRWMEPIVEAFNSIFYGIDSAELYDLTYGLLEFARSLKPNFSTYQKLRDVFIEIFAAIYNLKEPLQIIGKAFLEVLGIVAKVVAGIVILIARIINFATETGLLQNALYGIIEIFRGIATFAGTLGLVIVGLIAKISELGIVPQIIDGVRIAFMLLFSVIFGAIGSVVLAISQFVAKINELKSSGINVFLYAFNQILETISGTLKKVKDGVVGVFGFIVDKVKGLLGFKQALDNVADSEEKLYRETSKVKQSAGVFDTLKTSVSSFSDAVVGKIASVTTKFSEFFHSLSVGKIALASATAGIAGLAVKTLFFSKKSGVGEIGGAGGSIIDLLFNFSGIGKKILLIGALGSAVALLYKKFKDAKSTTKGLEETKKAVDNLADSEEALYRATQKTEKSKGIFGFLTNTFERFSSAISSKFKPATDAIKNFFHDLDYGRIIVGLFAGSVVASLAYVTITIGSLPLLIFSLTRTIWGLGNAIKNWSIWGVDTFGDTAIKIGQSILYLAGAMWVMAKIPADRFTEVANALKIFMGAMLAVTVLSSLLALFGRLTYVWEFGVSLMSLAASMMIVAGALKIVESLEPERLFTRFGEILLAIGALLVEVTLAAAAMNKLAPAFAVQIKGLVSIALSVAILAAALTVLSIIPPERLRAAGDALSLVIFGYAAVIAAVSSLAGKIGGALVSILALVSVAAAFKIMVDALVNIDKSGLGIDHIKNNWEKYAEVFGVLATFCLIATGMSFVIKKAGQEVAGAGVAVLAIAASFAIIIKGLSLLSGLKEKLTMWDIVGAILLLAGIGAGLFMVLKGFEKVGVEAAKASLALLAVTGTFVVLAALGAVIGLLPDNMYSKALGAMWSLAGCVAVILAASKLAEKVSAKPLLAIGALMLAIVGSLVLVAKYAGEDIKRLGASAGSIAGVLLSVAFVFLQLSKVSQNINSKPILSMALTIGVIAASLFFLSVYDWPKLAGAVGAIVVTLAAFTGVFYALKKLSTGWVDINLVNSLIGAIAVIAISLFALAFHPWQQIGAAAASISGVLLSLAGAYRIITDNFSGSVKVNYGALAALAVGLGIIGASLAGIAKYNWEQIKWAGIAMSGTLAVFASAFLLISNFGKGEFKSAAILPMVGALVVIGASLWAVSQQPWEQIKAAAESINATMLLLALTFAIVSAIAKADVGGALIGAASFTVMAVGVLALAGALKVLETVNFNAIQGGAITLGVFVAVLVGLGAVIAHVPLIAAGIGVILAALWALSYIVVPLVDPLVKLTEAFGNFIIKLAEARNIIAEGVSIMINAFGSLVLKVTVGISMVINAMANLLVAMRDTFAAAIPLVFQFGVALAAAFMVVGAGIGTGLSLIIITFISNIVEYIGQGITQIVNLIRGRTPEVSEAGGFMLDSLINTAYQKMPFFAKAITFLFVGGIGKAKEAGVKSMQSAVGDMATAADAGAKAKKSVFEGSGTSIGEFIINGLRDVLGWHSNPDFLVGGGSWTGLFPDIASAASSGTSAILPGLYSNGASMGEAVGNPLYNTVMSYVGKAWNGIQNVLAAAQGLEGLGFGGEEPITNIADLKRSDEQKWSDYKKQKDKEKRDRERYWNQENRHLKELGRKNTNYDDEGYYDASRMIYNNPFDKIGEDGDPYSPGGDSGGGGGGGGGGGAASEAAEEARKLFDVWKDGGKIIQKTAETFGEAYEALGFTHPLQLGEAAVQGLAEKLYDLSVAGVDAATLAEVTATEKLAKMKEEFDGFIAQIEESLLNAGDIFGNFAFNDTESISKWNKNLDKQETSIDLWVKHIEQLAKRTGDFNLVDQFIKFGPSEDKRLRKLLSSSDATIKQLGENMLSYLDADGKKLNDRTARLAAALASTTLEKAKETGDGVSNEASDTANEVTEAAENAADEIDATAKEATQNYVVVNRNGAVSVINEIGKVITANGELGKSAFDAAKVTEEAFGKMEDVYLSAKEAVSAAIGESIDLFSKFDTETEIDGEEMRENAREGLAAWEEMYNGMGALAEKGLNVDFILDKLVPMGEQAYGYVKEMLTWTEQDINEWNAMFEKSLSLPDQLAENLGRDLASATLLASQGFISGIGNDATYEAAKKVAIGFVDTMVQQINDPGSGAPQMGVAYAEAASKSIEENGSEVTNAAVKALNETVVVSKATAYDGGYDIGGELSRGIAQGIADKIEEVRASIFDLTATTEETTEDEFGIESPSKVFQRIGKFLDLGLAKGIDDNVGFINSASEAIGNSAINSMRAVVGHIADIINGDVEIDPTIRPVVDLSGVEEGVAAVNSMFGGRSYSMTRGIATMGHSDSVNDMISQMMAAQGSMIPVAAGGSPINMYVYAAPGQSEEEIANIVEQKLLFRINRNGGAWR